jgi:hypothetical protein
MKEPFNKPGDVKRSMSRIPFGGSAVLDIDRSPRRENEGVLSEKSCLLFRSDAGGDTETKSSMASWKTHPSLGLGDFVRASDSWDTHPYQKSACQMEAPYLLSNTHHAPGHQQEDLSECE